MRAKLQRHDGSMMQTIMGERTICCTAAFVTIRRHKKSNGASLARKGGLLGKNSILNPMLVSLKEKNSLCFERKKLNLSGEKPGRNFCCLAFRSKSTLQVLIPSYPRKKTPYKIGPMVPVITLAVQPASVSFLPLLSVAVCHTFFVRPDLMNSYNNKPRRCNSIVESNYVVTNDAEQHERNFK